MLDDAGPGMECPQNAGEDAAGRYVLSLVLPLWIASGGIDYWLHRRSKIEATSGTFESTLHAVGIGMSALPVLSGLFLEINSGVLLLMTFGFVAHIGMTIWDVDYASGLREVTPAEQHVHGMLELLPFTALSLMLVGHREHVLALAGRTGTKPRFAFRRKAKPVPGAAIGATLAAFTLLVAVPYAEELVRCIRYDRSSR
jgi:hypothetical protein